MTGSRRGGKLKEPVTAASVPAEAGRTIYPPPFDARVAGRIKRKLGDFFGLGNFGVNLTQLAPGAVSALSHHHSRQDEFIYVLDGTPTLVLGETEYRLQAGDCFGLPAGRGIGCQVINRSEAACSFLEIGDRTPGDEVEYPDDDLRATQAADGSWILTHKDGRPY